MSRMTRIMMLMVCFSLILAGCERKSKNSTTTKAESFFDDVDKVVKGDKYTILGTRTDQFDFSRAKAVAQDAIVKYPELNCMVGLFAYNPPKILAAVEEANKIGQIKIVGMDEDDATLKGIVDGKIYGTCVQNPYGYGYKSIEILMKLDKGEKDAIPANKFINMPAQMIRKENVQTFWDDLKKKLENAKAPAPTIEGAKRYAYVTNGIASFWTVAEAGVKTAAKDFNVNVEVLMPPKGASDQKRMIEDILVRGVDGIAVSPIDPDNQSAFLSDVAKRTNLITHDSDAPGIDRKVYIGMDNYEAGRMAGKLVKEALPEGGNVMIFIGRLEQDNAKLRRQGVIDELLDRPADRKAKYYAEKAAAEAKK